MRRNWVGLVAVVAAVAVTLTGCDGDASSTGSDAPTTTSSATDPSSDPPSESAEPGQDPTAQGCPYLTAEQVSEALGAPTTLTAGTLNACFFDPEGGGQGPTALVSRIDVQIDPSDYAAQSRVLCQGEVTEVEAGDEAFACVMGMGPLGQVYEDRVLITVLVTGAADDEAGVAAAAALLPLVTVPAGT